MKKEAGIWNSQRNMDIMNTHKALGENFPHVSHLSMITPSLRNVFKIERKHLVIVKSGREKMNMVVKIKFEMNKILRTN